MRYEFTTENITNDFEDERLEIIEDILIHHDMRGLKSKTAAPFVESVKKQLEAYGSTSKDQYNTCVQIFMNENIK